MKIDDLSFLYLNIFFRVKQNSVFYSELFFLEKRSKTERYVLHGKYIYKNRLNHEIL